MGTLLSFLYGVAAYVLSVVTLLYLIGFSGNLIVPRSVDVGASGAWPKAVLVDLLLLALFAVQHSVMARRGFKNWWTRLVPSAVERSTFLVATCIVLALLFWLWMPIPEPIVWKIDSPAGTALLWTAFGLGWMLVLLSTFLIDHFELFGLRQVYARLRGRAMPAAAFRTPLLYRHVRHPLYAGLLLGFWAAPLMTAGRLLFAVVATAYILIGISFEERDLIAQFGERYHQYRKEVGMLIPRRATRSGRLS